MTTPRLFARSRKLKFPHKIVDGIEAKRCCVCKAWKPIRDFHNNRSTLDRLCWACKPCTNACNRASSKAHYHERRARKRQYYAQYDKSERRRVLVSNKYRALKSAVIAGYGGRCRECGFDDHRALQIDHVAGNGSAERKSGEAPTTFLRRLIRERFPSAYQLLCANCNMIKMYENKEFPGCNSHVISEPPPFVFNRKDEPHSSTEEKPTEQHPDSHGQIGPLGERFPRCNRLNSGKAETPIPSQAAAISHGRCRD